MKRRVSFKVRGRVQGIAFRATARDQAQQLGLVGFIRNLEDGAVAGEVEGDASAVDAFLAWLKRGPPGARVDDLTTADATVAGLSKRFEIRT